ncbi:hypothetical protein F5Y18DRAFT_225376 [Xylariaceae sp. FL1019]|nr:hypothetical protein F5Y18DRAFT_225376 [Xylariaceae sp. FL1019]
MTTYNCCNMADLFPCCRATGTTYRQGGLGTRPCYLRNNIDSLDILSVHEPFCPPRLELSIDCLDCGVCSSTRHVRHTTIRSWLAIRRPPPYSAESQDKANFPSAPTATSILRKPRDGAAASRESAPYHANVIPPSCRSGFAFHPCVQRSISIQLPRGRPASPPFPAVNVLLKMTSPPPFHAVQSRRQFASCSGPFPQLPHLPLADAHGLGFGMVPSARKG